MVAVQTFTSKFVAQKGLHPGTASMPDLALTPLISLIAGVVILIMPRLLNYIVALYLIVIGLIGLFPDLVR
jgi:hypothetical protein